MPVQSLVVRKKEAADFFTSYKSCNFPVSWLKGVVKLQGGIEVTFVSEQTLRRFLEQIDGKSGWEVECELDATALITLAPRGQGGHVGVSDAIVVSFLCRFGEVKEGRRLVYADFPSVETGIRQFKVKLNGTAVPSSVNFGRASFFVSHRGQAKTCLKCSRPGHLAKECSIVVCRKCGQEGHVSRECSNEIVCTVCAQSGHTYSKCPKSYSGQLKFSSKFTAIAKNDQPSRPNPPAKEGSQTPPEASSISTQSEATDTQCDAAASAAENDSVDPSQDMFGSQDSEDWTLVRRNKRPGTSLDGSDSDSSSNTRNLVIDEDRASPNSRPVKSNQPVKKKLSTV